MNLNQFEIANKEKWDRAVHGEEGRRGETINGVGEGASDMEKLAAYDKIGGLIRKNGKNLKIGCFWDFKAKKARKKPEIIYQFRVEGQVVEIPEGEEIPVEVQASEIAQQKKAKKAMEEIERVEKKRKKDKDEE